MAEYSTRPGHLETYWWQCRAVDYMDMSLLMPVTRFLRKLSVSILYAIYRAFILFGRHEYK